MASMRLIPKSRGVKLRPYMRYMKEILFGILLFFFCVPLAFYTWTIWERILAVDVISIVIVVSALLFALIFSAVFSHLLIERTVLFAKWDRLSRLSRFLFEHNYVYEKKSSDGKKRKYKFPRIYLKQKKYDLEVHFELAGSKFQEKFKKIGGDLETTFAMDFMETEDDERFKMFRLAYSALRSRLKGSQIVYVPGKGIRLMDDLYWDFVSDPHMMVVGGTGGGKTVFLGFLIWALAQIGVVDICDPKRADFATMIDIEAFKGRVHYDIESIIEQFENSLKIMEERYDFMRSEQKRLGHTDMKTYSDYGLEPYFLVCDEYNALKAMLNYQMADRLDRAFGQLLLLGRQAGCFAVVAMQKPSREDLGSKLQANINFRVALGRLDEVGYDVTFEEVNRNKEFKFMKYIGGMRVFGRGYAAVKGQVAREFYSPEWTKDFVFFDEYSKLTRKEHKHRDLALSVHQEEVEPLPVADDSFPVELEEFYSVKDVADRLEKTVPQVQKLISLLKEGDYCQFQMRDEKYVFTVEEVFLFEELFEQKESGNKQWKTVLKDYFAE